MPSLLNLFLKYDIKATFYFTEFCKVIGMDFTLDKYIELCETIMKNYEALTVRNYLLKKPNGKVAILRHDVDRKPLNALKMAKIEDNLGITSTYYFRMKEGVFNPNIIKKIAGMGHEIGYHYEVLDKAKGDFKKAIEIFKEELKEFRKICNISTICMHGNPISKWTNKDLWKKYDFREFDIIGEPYLSIDYEKVFYFTDTSRKWNSRFSIKDNINENVNTQIKIKDTDDIIKIINNGQSTQVCILVHPNRWNDNFAEWFIELIWQNAKNMGKAAIKKYKKLI